MVVVVCVLLAGCAPESRQAAVSTSESAMIPRPLVERELDSLLVSGDQVDAAMGSSAMVVRSSEVRWPTTAPP